MLLQKTEKIDQDNGEYYKLDYNRIPFQSTREVWFGFSNEFGSSLTSGSGYKKSEQENNNHFNIFLVRSDLDFISIFNGRVLLHYTDTANQQPIELDFVSIIYHNRLKITIKKFPDHISFNT